MNPTTSTTAADAASTDPSSTGRTLCHTTRHRRARKSRIDRPDFRRGNMVWWNAGLYEVEAIEQHGERWIAVLVKPGQVGAREVRCWFAAVGELQVEP